MPIPAIAAPVGAAMVSGGADLMNNLFNLYSTNKTNKLNYKMFQEANQFAHDEAQLAFDRESQFAEKMFNAENEYNSPLQMLQRLEQAGLSPFDYFSNGNYMGASAQNVNSSAAVPGISHSMTAPILDINANGAINAFAQVIGAISESKYKDAQSWDLYNTANARLKDILADAGYKESQKAHNEFDMMIKEYKLPYEIRQMMIDYDNALADKDLTKARTLLTQIESSHEWQKKEALREQRPYLLRNAQHLYDVYSSEIERNRASASESYAHGSLMNAQEEGQRYTNDILWWNKEYNALDNQAKIRWLSNPENFQKYVDSYSKMINSSNMDMDKKFEMNKRLYDIYSDYNHDRNQFVFKYADDWINYFQNHIPIPLVNPSNY